MLDHSSQCTWWIIYSMYVMDRSLIDHSPSCLWQMMIFITCDGSWSNLQYITIWPQHNICYQTNNGPHSITKQTMVHNITRETTFQCRKRKHGPLSLETIIHNVRRKHMVQYHKTDHVTKRTELYGPCVWPATRVEQTLSLSDRQVQWSFVHPASGVVTHTRPDHRCR